MCHTTHKCVTPHINASHHTILMHSIVIYSCVQHTSFNHISVSHHTRECVLPHIAAAYLCCSSVMAMPSGASRIQTVFISLFPSLYFSLHLPLSATPTYHPHLSLSLSLSLSLTRACARALSPSPLRHIPSTSIGTYDKWDVLHTWLCPDEMKKARYRYKCVTHKYVCCSSAMAMPSGACVCVCVCVCHNVYVCHVMCIRCVTLTHLWWGGFG